MLFLEIKVCNTLQINFVLICKNTIPQHLVYSQFYILVPDTPIFTIALSRSGDIDAIPEITVHFANGVEDTFVLEKFQGHPNAPLSCNFIGRLATNHQSSVAVTGCLNDPNEDRMEITLLSEHNLGGSMFLVDANGNAEVIENPFTNGCTFL